MLSELLHIISIVYLSILFFFVYFRAKFKVNTSLYLISLYLFSVVGSLFLDESIAAPYDDYSIYATSVFLCLVTLFIFPVLIFDRYEVEHVEVFNLKLFNFICYVFIFIGLASYIYFVPKIFHLLSSLSDLRVLRGNLVGAESGLGNNYFYLILTLGCQFYPIVLLFYFHSMCYQPERKSFNRFLLFSSTAYIVNVLSNVGRDGFVLWTMSYLFAFIIYKNLLPNLVYRKVVKTFGFILGVFAILFFTISISRFYRDGSIYMFFQFLLLYFSQQFGEFNRFLTNVHEVQVDIVKIIPIAEFFFEPVNTDNILVDHKNFLANFGFDKYVFKTFLGMFYENLGLTVTFIVSLVMSFIFSLSMFVGRFRFVSFGKLIALTVFAQIMLHGIFYYKLGYMVSSIYVIICVFMAFIFSYKWVVK